MESSMTEFIESELNVKPTKDIKKAVASELEEEDGNIEELINDKDDNESSE